MDEVFEFSENQSVKIFIISDSIGETARGLVQAGLAQFPTLTDADIKQFPFVTQKEELENLLKDAVAEHAIVATTLVNSELNTFSAKFAKEHQLRYMDFMSDVVRHLSQETNTQPLGTSGALHRLDRDYFQRVAAIEFAVKYDDGKNPKGFLKSDIVLLGISRTSKTPLSMYLANRSYKVSNLPLIPEVSYPKELEQVDPKRIVGLTADAEYIMNIRSERLKMMGLDQGTTYNNLARIKLELSYAEELYDTLGATVINVQNRSIEEVAQCIEEELNITRRDK